MELSARLAGGAGPSSEPPCEGAKNVARLPRMPVSQALAGRWVLAVSRLTIKRRKCIGIHLDLRCLLRIRNQCSLARCGQTDGVEIAGVEARLEALPILA